MDVNGLGIDQLCIDVDIMIKSIYVYLICKYKHLYPGMFSTSNWIVKIITDVAIDNAMSCSGVNTVTY